jgi:hypothetical protein
VEGRSAANVPSALAGIRPAKPGAASFREQVDAAKTPRDPLLDKILSVDKPKPVSRR